MLTLQTAKREDALSCALPWAFLDNSTLLVSREARVKSSPAKETNLKTLRFFRRSYSLRLFLPFKKSSSFLFKRKAFFEGKNNRSRREAEPPFTLLASPFLSPEGCPRDLASRRVRELPASPTRRVSARPRFAEGEGSEIGSSFFEKSSLLIFDLAPLEKRFRRRSATLLKKSKISEKSSFVCKSVSSKGAMFKNKNRREKISYEEIGLFPRSFSRVFDRFIKQLFNDVENLVLQEYRFYRYLFLTTVKCLFILLLVPFLVNLFAKNYVVRPLTEYIWNTKQSQIFLNAYQLHRGAAELKNFEDKLYFESFASAAPSDLSCFSHKKTLFFDQKLKVASQERFLKGKTSAASPSASEKKKIIFLEVSTPSPSGRPLFLSNSKFGKLRYKKEVTGLKQICLNFLPPPKLFPFVLQSKKSKLSLMIRLFLPSKNALSFNPKLKEERFFESTGSQKRSDSQFGVLASLTPREVRPRGHPSGGRSEGARPEGESFVEVASATKTKKKPSTKYSALQKKTEELAKTYNDESIEAITNFFADLISVITFLFLLVAMEIPINISKSFLLEVFFGLDDSKKSLLILLVTDLLVGYHSDGPWAILFEYLFNHYGLPESQTGIFLLVATLPVLLDVLFKYLIFRHLNRASPATVATYHAMIE